MKWVRPGHEFDDISNLFIDGNVRYYIWGYGVLGKAFYEAHKDHLLIAGFIDSNAKKQGKMDDITVYSPDDISVADNEVIIVATGWIREIETWMQHHGLKRNINYFRMEDFATNFQWYKYGKVYFDILGFMCNTVCTLKCKHCIGLIPYARNKCTLTYEEMVTSIDNVFGIIDWVNVLGLSGGDAIINKDISRFIEYIGEKFLGRQLQRIELYTNGVILPDNEMLIILKKYDVIVRISDYGKETKGKQKISEVTRLLDIHEVQFERVVFDTWVDIGFPQESNGIFERCGAEGLEKHCEACSPVICSTVYRDKLFYCSPVAYAYASGLFELDDGDWFDLSKADASAKSELREFYLGYSKNGFPSYCMKCNGLFNNNLNRITPGVQL